jgi:hypothetical protein
VVQTIRGILGYYVAYAHHTQKTPRDWILWYLRQAVTYEGARLKAVRP